MIPVMCVVQEGQISLEREYALKSAINLFTQRVFGQIADIDWIEVAKGNGFTAAESSTTLIASLRSSRQLRHGERLPLLNELREICRQKTGCSIGDVMTSIRDPQN